MASTKPEAAAETGDRLQQEEEEREGKWGIQERCEKGGWHLEDIDGIIGSQYEVNTRGQL